MKYTVDIPQNMGEPQEVNHSLTNTLLALFVLLEKKGLKFSPSFGEKITPEVLEKLLLESNEEVEKKDKLKFNQPIFGMWADREDMADPSDYVRQLRKSRYQC